MYSKHALSSPGAPTDHGLLQRTGEEAARVDRQALARRAEAAAKSAALRYSEVCEEAYKYSPTVESPSGRAPDPGWPVAEAFIRFSIGFIVVDHF